MQGIHNQIVFDFDNNTESFPVESKPDVRSLPFRPIHYLGSKLRIIDLVREVIDGVDKSWGPVCDLFSGSGTVSRELSNYRSVIAVDMQEYSRVLCSALLSPSYIKREDASNFLNKALLSEHAVRLSWAVEPMIAYEANCRYQAEMGNVEPLCQFLEHASIISFQHSGEYVNDAGLRSALNDTISRLRDKGLANSPGSLATRYFGGIYFSYAQATQIDMFLEAVSTLQYSNKDIFLAAILSTASEIVNTVGKQFAQPIRPRFSDGRPKPKLLERVSRDRTIDTICTFKSWIEKYMALRHSDKQHSAIRGDYKDVLDNLGGKVSVIYADPPYTRDHYSRYYHVLETLCSRDCPKLSMVRINGNYRISRGMYRIDRYQSPFCIKSKAPQAFSTLFAKARKLNIPLIVSYSPFEKDSEAMPRLMTIDNIISLARKSFNTVEAATAGRIAHSKLNRSDMNKAISYSAETFIICKP